MNTSTLLKKLEAIKEEKQTIKQVEKFDALLQEIKTELYYSENNFDSTEKQGNKKAAALLKKWGKGSRPVLGACDFQEIEGEIFQVFTDGYIMFMLKRFYNLKTMDELRQELPHVEDYPSVNRLVPPLYNGEELENSMEKIKEILKLYKCKALKNNDGSHLAYFESRNNKDVWFNAEYLSNIVKVLGTANLEVYIYGNIKPIQFYNTNTGDRAILMPVRYDGNKEGHPLYRG